MPTKLTASCDAFALTVTEPEAPGQKLTGAVEFRSGSRATSAKVELVLFAQFVKERMGHPRLGGETGIAGCAVTVQRGSELSKSTVAILRPPDLAFPIGESRDSPPAEVNSAGPTPRGTPSVFALPLPVVAAAYSGNEFNIDVGVRVTADEGSELRVVVDVSKARSNAELVLRGLPKSMPLDKARRFGFGIALLGVAAIFLALGYREQSVPLYLGVGLWVAVAGVLLASLSARGILGWFLFGRTSVTLEAQRGESGSELIVTLRNTRRLAKARARLRAAEFERNEGYESELSEIAVTESAMLERDGQLQATVQLPETSQAPPSLAMSSGRRTLLIRWLLILERETARGFVVRNTLPLAVGVAQARANQPAIEA